MDLHDLDVPLYEHSYNGLKIESLSGGPWGYRHFEIAARYLRNLGLSCTGQTGSFRRSWGDFGTVRSQAALDLECFNMLAQAAKCGVGDHLHPRGVLNPPVYERIGRTYRSVREKEPWCEGVRAVTELAIFLPPHGPTLSRFRQRGDLDVEPSTSSVRCGGWKVRPEQVQAG